MSTQVETLEATIQTDTLKSFIDAVRQVTDECKLQFGGGEEPALSTRAVDPANVAMVDVTMEESAFETYNGFSETTVIGVSTDRMKDILSTASGDLITIEWAGGGNKIVFSSGGLTFNMGGIDPASVRQEPDFPDLGLPNTATIDVDEIDRGVNAAELVSDHIVIGATAAEHSEDGEAKLHITAEGDTDDVEIVWNETGIHDLSVTETGESIYSVDYMNEVATGLGSFDDDATPTINVGEEFPIMIDWSFVNGDGRGTYLIAPRIQND